jgi:glucose-1-phosphate cytidylyltransferase
MSLLTLGTVRLVVLAGGRGTRLGDLTKSNPKPLVVIGGRPILWHILTSYAAAGVRSAVIATGYLGEQISATFRNRCDVEVVDTGLHTGTAGRLRRVASRIPGEIFCLTYGDGVSDVPIADVIEFHLAHDKIATLTAVNPPGRFGSLDLTGDQVVGFAEKRRPENEWINGGFMVFSREVFDFINGDSCSLERDVLARLAVQGELMAYRHDGFWQCMDTASDAEYLNMLWDSGSAPWRTW